MRKGAVSCVGLFCAFAACGSSAPAPQRDRIANLKRALDTALFECPDRVWPGTAAGYRASQVLLVSPEAGTAYLWNDQREAPTGQSPPMTLLATADLDPEWLGTFNIGTLFGFPTLGVSLDETARINERFDAAGATRWHDYAVGLTLHEAFHFLGTQQLWPAAGVVGTRSIPYPQPFEPRFLRAALASSLLTHLRDGGGDATLAAAAFWQGRFVTEHAADAEAIRNTDIDEGTAQYAEVIGSALFERGCAASEAVLMEAVLAHIDEFVNVRLFDGGYEPYQLGLLAGLGARLRGAPLAGWEGRVESGETPVQVLVGDTAAVAQTDDPNLSFGARTAVETSNSEVAAEVTPLLARMTSADHVRLPVPVQWTVGSFRLSGFVHLVDEPGVPEVLLKYQATHQMPGGPTITVAQTIVNAVPEACSTSPVPMRIATFPAAAFTTDITTGRFTLSSTEVSFTGLPAQLVQDAAGLTWMCPQTAAAATDALVAYAGDVPRRPFTPLDCDRLRLSLR
jgi:hypothetical protein